MKSKIDKILEIILVLVLVGLVFEGIYLYYHWPREDEFNPTLEMNGVDSVEKEKATKKPSIEKIATEQKLSVPEEINLEIPFILQAPFSDWSYPFNHTCEEAAVLMAHYYLEGKTIIEPAVARKELLALVEYEKKNYGFHEDTSTEQTAQLIRDYYGYKVKVYYDISLEDIKKELARGNPVIVPTAGRLLNNPYFTPPGPIYHMLVVKGYTPTEFITNDPGTKRGADYSYSYQVLEKAIHDWNNGDVENGKSAMISIQK
ncbi:C39 family peptidase [bacterium]|nr:C39 family peptidase [bacterium]